MKQVIIWDGVQLTINITNDFETCTTCVIIYTHCRSDTLILPSEKSLLKDRWCYCKRYSKSKSKSALL